MDRREFLVSTALVAATPLLPGCGSDTGGSGTTPIPSYSWDGDVGPESLFSHGVASGDPWDESVVLWTRVTIAGSALATANATEAPVFWEVATDQAFTDRVAAGEGVASSDRDFTFKPVAEGLSPSTTYYYRFWTQGRSSPVGRTRTTGAATRIRLGVCSCANYATGYYVAYRGLSKRADLDAVLHLGDYIYESSYGTSLRPNEPKKETVTLEDYRIRYAHYRSDPDLQEVHRQHPFICVWDDHETANNSHTNGAAAHDPDTEGDWPTRKGAGTQAWREWLPVRDLEGGKIWRKHSWDGLADLFMLDTRLWARDPQTTPSKKEIIADPKRSFLGEDQEKWLHAGLVESKAPWKVLGQQVMMGQLQINGTAINTDQWDGYAPTRDRLFGVVRDKGVDGLVVLTGDIHTSWAIDLVEDSSDDKAYDAKTGKGALGVEFVVPGITSGGFGGGAAALGELAQEYNPHIRWAELTHRGYGVLDLTPTTAQCDWYLYATVKNKDEPEKQGGSWKTTHGDGHLTKADAPVADKPDASPTAT